MQIGKIYVLTWFVSIAVAVGLYLAGLLNELKKHSSVRYIQVERGSDSIVIQNRGGSALATAAVSAVIDATAKRSAGALPAPKRTEYGKSLE